ncbi:leucine--tRNA ligase [Candidatus Falkowbacteria bacterium CG10_big_fil_rev_8_21_14_0_10_39_9]|uniref:Leucine--tRNA ligase n=1 Tax=Candidatus Falkowbacteria bacterium CG10_big_fil_rev_8_21_14_0_10_39_9 TaxID=1974566 RepID=A0A2M6WQ50_9BACT|nr:MAG: leucine--tRNA ligase [Candidatus Falkowbacteria bacterium CG10_big_fil_rev_8_21_14_0_10_39_9]
MYDHLQIEKKWQQKWRESQLYRVGEDQTKPKYYILDMFPYPSGVGLHVGHPKGYIATDILARLKIMQGFNVLHPMGFDAFGLPTENYAIKNKMQPQGATDINIANYKRQLEILGFTYDWEREIKTTDPRYYKWTQWAFLKMFEAGLVFESYEPINWCPSCKTGLANEDLEDGKCERCGSEIEQKPMRQWVIRITDYAERLLADLDKLPEWETSIKEMQKNWIGKSEGAEINFGAASSELKIKVFTTRVDTIFGCTYVVLAPENELVEKLKSQITNWSQVAEYIAAVKNKTNLERTDLNKDKTGVKLEGVQAINPFNGEKVAVFIADYVLNSYGTGAVMAVPAHDERDYEFAQKYGISIKKSISPAAAIEAPDCYTDDGLLLASGEFTGLNSASARTQMIAWLEKNNQGNKKVNYKLQDWVFSRQRYWGEPIPIIHCAKCGAVPVPYEQLPLTLPNVKSYEPSGTGESPLATIADWVNTTCPKCGGPAQRETNTMPQWAGSSWYYLRYIDPHNDKALVDKAREKYWSPVDFYVGGAEHATRHLFYARFWHKFLFDIGVVNYEEPFKKLKAVGLIIGEDGRKMSKRWGNVINPDEVVAQYGADSLRLYEMFMSPFSDSSAWNTKGLIGVRKFLDRVINITTSTEPDSAVVINLLHKTIKKVADDILDFKFNTAVSAMMILVNAIYNQGGKLSQANYPLLLQILAPFAPHLAEELWANIGQPDSIFRSSYPTPDVNLMKDSQITMVVSVNGKMRASLELPTGISESEVLALALEHELVKKWLEGKEIVKKIFVPDKLINIVIKYTP